MKKQFIVIKTDHQDRQENIYGPFETENEANNWINNEMSVFVDISKFFVKEIFKPKKD